MTHFFNGLISRLEARQSLVAEDMLEAVEAVASNQVSHEDLVRFLVLLRDKGETEDELYGLVCAMHARMTRVDLGTSDFIDTCGTGGSIPERFNLSTAASLLAVSAGAKIAKHGNRAASSQSGSADFLEALGYPLALTLDDMRCLFERTRFCFFFAPQFHPVMAHFAKARREIGTKTIFNSLGPLLNPAGARRQVIGVYSRDRAALISRVIARFPEREALVVYGHDGLDEVTLTGLTTCFHVKQGSINEQIIDPTALGFSLVTLDALRGGHAIENAGRFLEMCDRDDRSPLREAIILNAAVMLAFYRSEMLASNHIHEIREAFSPDRKAVRALMERWI